MPRHPKLRTRTRHAQLRWLAGAEGLLLAAALSCGGDATMTSSDVTGAGATPAAAISSNGVPAPQTGAGAPAVSAGPRTGASGSAVAASAAAGVGATLGGRVAVSMPVVPGAAAAGAPAAGAHAHDAAAAGSGSMSAAEMHCLLETHLDPRDEMLTGEPLTYTSGSNKDLLVPQLVLDWMAENEFESAHDGWHLVRKWDQSCLKSNASASSCRSRLFTCGRDSAQ